MGGGGPKKTTTTTHGDVPSWFLGPSQQALAQLSHLGLDPNSPYAALLGQVPQDIAYANQGLQTLSQFAQGGATNPYLDQYANRALSTLNKNYTQTVAPGAMSQAVQSGAFGGSGDAEQRALNQFGYGESAGNLLAGIYEPAYEANQNRALQAAGGLFSSANQMAEWPMRLANQVISGITSLAGPYSGTTTIAPNLNASGSKL